MRNLGPRPRGVDAVGLILEMPWLCPGCWHREAPGRSVGPIQDAARDSPESVPLRAPWAGPIPALTRAQTSMPWAGVGCRSWRPGWDELLQLSLRRGGLPGAWCQTQAELRRRERDHSDCWVGLLQCRVFQKPVFNLPDLFARLFALEKCCVLPRHLLELFVFPAAKCSPFASVDEASGPAGKWAWLGGPGSSSVALAPPLPLSHVRLQPSSAPSTHMPGTRHAPGLAPCESLGSDWVLLCEH